VRSALQIGLRAGERIYINGAVLRVDRKVRLELLNNATFLIGSHVMQLDEATTPMRQLYFLIQSLMMDPGVADSLRPAVDAMIAGSTRDTRDPARVEVLLEVGRLVSDGSAFEALKAVRGLVQAEDQVSRALAGTQLDLEVA
jgi:flagellar biosynthesis repressor protein FlbT